MELKETRRILERHGIRLRKDLGQNFLIEPSVPRRTAEAAAPEPGYGVLEIGPGAGAHGGYIIAAGTPQEVMNNPKSIT